MLRTGPISPERGTQKAPATVSDRIKTRRDRGYAALQKAVDAFGGEQAFAEAMGVSLTDTHLRVNRKEDSKLKLQRAFYDFIFFLDDESAAILITELNDLFGFEPPVRRRRIAPEDIGHAWLRSLEALPPGEREGRRRDMAAALGVRPEDLKL